MVLGYKENPFNSKIITQQNFVMPWDMFIKRPKAWVEDTKKRTTTFTNRRINTGCHKLIL